MTAVVIFIGGPLLVQPLTKLKGLGLNSRAWRASYSERGLHVPSRAARGVVGDSPCPAPRPPAWNCSPERHIPGYFDIDRWGMQSAIGAPAPKIHLLIVGGQCGGRGLRLQFGADLFSPAGPSAGGAACPVKVTVLATGAWTSTNELQAFRYRGMDSNPIMSSFLMA